MSEEKNWNWVEIISKSIPVPFTIFLLGLAIINFIINIILITKLLEGSRFDKIYWNDNTCIILVSFCILIIYEPWGVGYFVNSMRDTFRKLEMYPDRETSKEELFRQLKIKFTQSKLYYIIIAFVIIPFIVIDPLRGKYYFWSTNWKLNIYSISLDGLNFAMTFLVLSSMATILWIIFNISWALDKLGSEPYLNDLKIDLFSSDRVGGLSQVRGLILKLTVFNFIGISLFIISFITPSEIIYDEIIFSIIIFLANLFLFIKGWHTINKLLGNRRKREVNAINDLYQKLHDRLPYTISKDNLENKEESLTNIIAYLELLQKEREQLLQASKWTYDFKTNFTFFSSSLLPFITAYILPLIYTNELNQQEFLNRLLESLMKFRPL